MRQETSHILPETKSTELDDVVIDQSFFFLFVFVARNFLIQQNETVYFFLNALLPKCMLIYLFLYFIHYINTKLIYNI